MDTERAFGEGESLQDLSVIRKLSYGFLALAVVNTVANLFFSDLNLIKVFQLRSSTMRLEKLIGAEEGKNLELKAVYERIRKNPKFYREKFIREYLLMFREGEKVIPLPKELWYR